jgi:hypothetical protein
VNLRGAPLLSGPAQLMGKIARSRWKPETAGVFHAEIRCEAWNFTFHVSSSFHQDSLQSFRPPYSTFAREGGSMSSVIDTAGRTSLKKPRLGGGPGTILRVQAKRALARLTRSSTLFQKQSCAEQLVFGVP